MHPPVIGLIGVALLGTFGYLFERRKSFFADGKGESLMAQLKPENTVPKAHDALTKQSAQTPAKS